MKTALFYPVSYSSERQEEKSSSLRGANKRAYFGKISGHAMSPLFFGGTKTPTILLFRGKRRRCAGDSINLLLVVWLLPLRGVGYTIQMIMKGKYLKRRRYFPFPFSLGWTVIDSKLKGKVYYLLRPFSLGWTININRLLVVRNLYCMSLFLLLPRAAKDLYASFRKNRRFFPCLACNSEILCKFAM